MPGMSNYAQIPTSLICRFSELTKTEIVVVSYLYGARNRKTGQCNPSRSAIARAVGVDRAHVGRAVEGLESKEWIFEMAEGGWTLFSEPPSVAKSATESVAECATVAKSAHVQNPQHNVAESATDPCEMRNTLNKDFSEQKKEHRNEQKKKDAIASSPHSTLMRHHAKRVEKITDGAAQGKVISNLLKNFSVEDCIGCYDYEVQELDSNPGGWRSGVSWKTVSPFIAEWIVKGRPESPVKKNGTHRSANDRAERAITKHNYIAGLREKVAARNVSGSGDVDSS